MVNSREGVTKGEELVPNLPLPLHPSCSLVVSPGNLGPEGNNITVVVIRGGV